MLFTKVIKEELIVKKLSMKEEEQLKSIKRVSDALVIEKDGILTCLKNREGTKDIKDCDGSMFKKVKLSDILELDKISIESKYKGLLIWLVV